MEALIQNHQTKTVTGGEAFMIFFNFTQKNRISTNFTHSSDEELLGFMRQGIEQALAELFRRYYAPLYLKAYKRISSAWQVEEMVQDVFVNIWTKAATLDTDSNVKAYLYATLRNKVLHELRTEAIHNFHAAKFAMMSRSEKDNDTNNADILHAKLTEQYVSKVIAGLSPHCREAFLLSRTEHLTYREIAQRMGISVSTVEKHVTKALQVLRKKLSEYDDLALLALLTILLHA